MCYVKFILNELKRPEIICEICESSDEPSGNGVDNNGYENNEIGTKAKTNCYESDISSSTSKTKKTKSIKEIIAKALFLDVVRDYVNIVIKERLYNGRWILILFLVIAVAANALPFHNGIETVLFDSCIGNNLFSGFI